MKRYLNIKISIGIFETKEKQKFITISRDRNV